MHRNDGSDRISEPNTDHGYVSETHFVGDSQTADSLDNLAKVFEDRISRVEQRLEHVVRHDRTYPTDGCEYCGVPSAA